MNNFISSCNDLLEDLIQDISKQFNFTKKDNELEFDFEEFQSIYEDDPAAFAKDILGFNADEKQKEILESVRDHKRVSVTSGQGTGKTAVISCLILWYMCTKYESKIIITSPSMNQLFTVLWSEISKWFNGTILEEYLTKTKTRLYMNGYEDTWFTFPKTATTKEGMAGLHADNMLIIVDEASGVKDEILETLLGTISGADNKILFSSNPTRTNGIFFDSHHKDRAKYKCISINSEECSRVDKENIDMIAKKYGKDSNVYKVRVKGEFPSDEDDVYFKLHLVMQGVNNKIDIVVEDAKTIDIGVDVAREGNDETIIAPKVNNKVLKLLSRHGQDTMKTAGDTLRLARDLHEKYPGVKKVAVKIDDTGVGGGVTDRLKEIKKQENLEWLLIVPVKFGLRKKHKYYWDTTTIMASIVKEQLEDQEEPLSLPEDDELVAQLSSRKYEMQSNSTIKLESKKEMKKRGLPSPDRADAVFLACLPVNIKEGRQEKKKRK